MFDEEGNDNQYQLQINYAICAFDEVKNNPAILVSRSKVFEVSLRKNGFVKNQYYCCSKLIFMSHDKRLIPSQIGHCVLCREFCLDWDL